MKKTVHTNEYDRNQTNRMILRIPSMDSYMNNIESTTPSQKMNVVIQFPETSETSDYIIDEVKVILLEIFQKNMKEQYKGDKL
ncbi:MAG: hypothetical protein IJ282_07915 [Lachnospiraceae bacterium]|nr:hypothetical protein [Lachnospiraceae bacterium]